MKRGPPRPDLAGGSHFSTLDKGKTYTKLALEQVPPAHAFSRPGLSVSP